MLALAAGAGANRLAILDLTQIEVRSAIRRREKAGDIPPLVANHILESFRRHSEMKFTVQALTSAVLDIASGLVDRYALRAFDAVQLGGYFALRQSGGADTAVFVCSDLALLAAAKQERILTLDPVHDP